jgi:L-lactate dehydrogenase complex protein LldG
MSDTLADEFAASLGEVDVAVTRTTTADFASSVDDAVTSPAVGVELPFEALSLAETTVTVDPTPALLRGARTGVTAGSLGVTSYGSLVLRCTGAGAEFLALFPDEHVVVLAADDVVEDMPNALDAVADPMRDEAADFVVATGPSATADMGSVVQGVHGPSDVRVLLVEDR